jgi:hypothetical protein
MREEITKLDFLTTIEDLNYLRHLRIRLYQEYEALAQGAVDRVHYNSFYDTLRDYYSGNGVLLVSKYLQTSNQNEFTIVCDNYYRELGYEGIDGKFVNPDSLFVLAKRGELELSPSTFNLALLPWTLEDSITLDGCTEPKDLREYGWSRETLISALAPNDDLTRLSKQELVARYRLESGCDGHIDWSQVKKYRYLSYESLYRIMLLSFNKKRDVVEGMSYEELVRDLEIMCQNSLELRKQADEIFKQTRGYISGVLYEGAAYILRSGSEHPAKSLWYPNLSEDICLMYRGIPIPEEILGIDYASFTWARKRQNEISSAFFIMIAQKLGLWKLIKKQTTTLNNEIICDKIILMLEEILLSRGRL